MKKERELGELKSRFVAMASHEFRTPLTTIRASVDLLEHYGDRMRDDKKTTYLQEIAREVTNITELLDDILTIGRAEARRFELKPEALDLHRLCTEMIDMASLDAKPGHELKFDWKGDLGDIVLDRRAVFQGRRCQLQQGEVQGAVEAVVLRLCAACADLGADVRLVQNF